MFKYYTKNFFPSHPYLTSVFLTKISINFKDNFKEKFRTILQTMIKSITTTKQIQCNGLWPQCNQPCYFCILHLLLTFLPRRKKKRKFLMPWSWLDRVYLGSSWLCFMVSELLGLKGHSPKIWFERLTCPCLVSITKTIFVHFLKLNLVT